MRILYKSKSKIDVIGVAINVDGLYYGIIEISSWQYCLCCCIANMEHSR